jgi:hypothetical protein
LAERERKKLKDCNEFSNNLCIEMFLRKKRKKCKINRKKKKRKLSMRVEK